MLKVLLNFFLEEGGGIFDNFRQALRPLDHGPIFGDLLEVKFYK